ncbi:uncharacterized protein [Gossypium hirsutum]|uniref:Uncharacterized protein isoform X2 n=1 Tax=Gossypium hirsutum TaxID=3635 RepID=A0ABM2ZN05_GOSHI|nr:uncharacterized protein LOC107927621 isoform X2 [Gossypium hirsutum]
MDVSECESRTEEETMELQHFSHPHPLVFFKYQTVASKEVDPEAARCFGCENPLEGGSYGCNQWCSLKCLTQACSLGKLSALMNFTAPNTSSMGAIPKTRVFAEMLDPSMQAWEAIVFNKLISHHLFHRRQHMNNHSKNKISYANLVATKELFVSKTMFLNRPQNFIVVLDCLLLFFAEFTKEFPHWLSLQT